MSRITPRVPEAWEPDNEYVLGLGNGVITGPSLLKVFNGVTVSVLVHYWDPRYVNHFTRYPYSTILVRIK